MPTTRLSCQVPESILGNKKRKQAEENRHQQNQEQPAGSQRRRSARLVQKNRALKQEVSLAVTDQSEQEKQLINQRKRAIEVEESFWHPADHPEKRRRTSGHVVNGENDQILLQECSTKSKRPFQDERLPDSSVPLPKRPRTNKDEYVEYWVTHNYQIPKKPLTRDSMEHWFAQKASSLRHTKSSTSLNTTSETSSQKSRNKYDDKNFEIFLQTKGSFLYDHENEISNSSKAICEKLLMKQHEIPKGTKFDDNIFKLTCRTLQGKNETAILRKIADLIVPSAEDSINLGLVKFKNLTETMNEAWDNSLSLDATPHSSQTQAPLQPPLPPPLQTSKRSRFQLPRPQPDYAVGYSRKAFSEDQLRRLAPFFGDIGDPSFFMGTADMHFPFLTSEVKGKAALQIADRQNAHSMTLAVRGVVELFRIVKREKELNREILGFSISHDYCSVRIYGHYPVIDGEKVTYYRHSVHKFDFTTLDGRDKWTSYKFTMNVYSDWAASHFKMLCSAIDQIPYVDFEVSQRPEVSEQPEILRRSDVTIPESTGLSPGVSGVDLGVGLGSSFTSLPEEDNPPHPDPKEAALGNQVGRAKTSGMRNKRKRIA